MKVTKPMIERGTRAYQSHPTMEPREVVEAVLRAALNDPAEPPKPIEGQTSIGIARNGETIILESGPHVVL